MPRPQSSGSAWLRPVRADKMTDTFDSTPARDSAMPRDPSDDYDRPAGRYRDDYDRPRSRPPAPEPDSGGNTAVKIIAIIGGVVVAISLVCGGLAYYVFYSVKKGAERVGDGVADVVEKQQQQFALEQQRMQK